MVLDGGQQIAGPTIMQEEQPLSGAPRPRAGWVRTQARGTVAGQYCIRNGLGCV